MVIASVIGWGLGQLLQIDRLPSALCLPAVLVATGWPGRGRACWPPYSARWPASSRWSTAMRRRTSTLAQLVRLAVPQLADYSLLDILSPEGEVVRVGLAHRDPVREAELTKRWWTPRPARASAESAAS